MPICPYPSPLGELTLVAADGALVAILFPDEQLHPPLDGRRDDDEPVLRAAASQLDEYFAGDRCAFDLPLAPHGTPFQLRVWEALRAIPYGETEGYGGLAARIGRPTASRAVGQANGRNPLPIVVPCHRVIGTNGTLTGYAGGIDRKRWLLDHEARHGPAARLARSDQTA